MYKNVKTITKWSCFLCYVVVNVIMTWLAYVTSSNTKGHTIMYIKHRRWWFFRVCKINLCMYLFLQSKWISVRWFIANCYVVHLKWYEANHCSICKANDNNNTNNDNKDNNNNNMMMMMMMMMIIVISIMLTMIVNAMIIIIIIKTMIVMT